MSAANSSSSSTSSKIVSSVSLSGTGQIIELINSNILEADNVDAIVYTEVSSSVELSGTEVLTVGGEEIEKQVKSFITLNGPLDSADKIVIVDGGKLKAKHVIFAAGPMWKGGKKNERQIMEEIVNTCLEESNKKQFNSIGFDAMCTDLFGFPTERSAEAIINAIFNWSHFKSFPYCNSIKIFIHEPEKMQVFAQCLDVAYQAYLRIGKQETIIDESSVLKRKNDEDQPTEVVTTNNEGEGSDDDGDDSDDGDAHNSKRVKSSKKFGRNAAWKRGRHENTILAKAKKNNIHDKSTNMSIVGDTMSISTSIAMDDLTNMKDDENGDDSSNFDMTFL